MTIATKLHAVLNIKQQLQTAIKAKGVAIDGNTPFSEYPGKISGISASDPNNGGFTHVIGLEGTLQIKRFTVPQGVTTIGPGDVPSNIEELILPEGVKSLQTNALANSPRLKKVVLPSTFKSIPVNTNGVFNNCPLLEDINLQYLEDIAGNSTFAGTAIKIADLRNSKSSAIPHSCFLWNKNLHTVLTSLNLTAISISGFADCTALENFDFAHIVQIQSNALKNTAFKSINLPNATDISNQAFFDTPKLERVTFSDRIVYIGQMFNSNNGLKSLIFPANAVGFTSGAVSIIVSSANHLKYVEINSKLTTCHYSMVAVNLPALEVVKCNAVVPPRAQTSSPPFNVSLPNFKLYVPDQSVDAYKAASGWINLARYIAPMSEFVMPSL